MAERLTGILDRIIALMEGGTATRDIPSGRFEHFEVNLEEILTRTVVKPYPFTVRIVGWRQPLDVPSDVSGNYRFNSAEIEIQVAYGSRPHDEYKRQATIAEDYSAMWRTLTEPRNFSQTGFIDATSDSADIRDALIGDREVQDLLVFSLYVTYREDHSS